MTKKLKIIGVPSHVTTVLDPVYMTAQTAMFFFFLKNCNSRLLLHEYESGISLWPRCHKVFSDTLLILSRPFLRFCGALHNSIYSILNHIPLPVESKYLSNVYIQDVNSCAFNVGLSYKN